MIVKIKYGSTALLSALVLLLGSCNVDEPDPPGQDEVGWARTELVMSSATDLMEELAFKGIAAVGRTSDREEGDFLTCAVISSDSIDQVRQRVTLDFSGGCLGPYGVERKGKLVVVFDRDVWEFGSEISVMADSFYIHGVRVEGVLKLTNNTPPESGEIIHEVIFAGGKFFWSEKIFATREEKRTRIWERKTDALEDLIRNTGSASGEGKLKETYQVTIEEALFRDRTCMLKQGVIPVFGTERIITEKLDFTIGYGNNACNRTVTLTRQGKSREIGL